MRVLLLEDNLLWSVRLANGIRALGHEASGDASAGPFDLAIVNLSSPACCDEGILGALKSEGTVIVGHAGHKEAPILRRGVEVGCDHTVSNGTLSHKLADVLALAVKPFSQQPGL